MDNGGLFANISFSSSRAIQAEVAFFDTLG